MELDGMQKGSPATRDAHDANASYSIDRIYHPAHHLTTLTTMTTLFNHNWHLIIIADFSNIMHNDYDIYYVMLLCVFYWLKYLIKLVVYLRHYYLLKLMLMLCCYSLMYH